MDRYHTRTATRSTWRLPCTTCLWCGCSGSWSVLLSNAQLKMPVCPACQLAFPYPVPIVHLRFDVRGSRGFDVPIMALESFRRRVRLEFRTVHAVRTRTRPRYESASYIHVLSVRLLCQGHSCDGLSSQQLRQRQARVLSTSCCRRENSSRKGGAHCAQPLKPPTTRARMKLKLCRRNENTSSKHMARSQALLTTFERFDDSCTRDPNTVAVRRFAKHL